MKNNIFKVTRPQGYALCTFVAIACVFSFAFQNCAGISADLIDPEGSLKAFEGIMSASTEIGMDDSTAAVKMAVIVDNSNTMTNSNIKLKDSFGDFFDGISADALQRMDIELVVLNTAQNVLKTPNNYQTLSSALTTLLQSQEYNFSGGRTPASILQGTRLAAPATDLAGDVLGIKAVTTGGTLKKVEFGPAPVRSISTTAPVEVIHLPRRGNINALRQDFQDRLEILDPRRLSTSAFNDGTLLGDTVSNESGTCALARLLVKDKSFFTANEIPVVVVVSDEDDQFVDGNNCLASIAQESKSLAKVAGFCEGPKTKLVSYKNQTKFTLTLTTPASGAVCNVIKSNMFDITYNYAPVNISYKRTTIKYYGTKTEVFDGQPVTKIDTVQRTYELDEDMALGCNDANRIKTLVVAKDGTTITTNASYPITCTQVVNSKVDPSKPNVQKLSVANAAKLLKFNDPRVTAAGVTAAQVYKKDLACSTQVISLISTLDPELTSSRRTLVTTGCKVLEVRQNDVATKTETVDKTNNVSSAQCQSMITSSCVVGDYCEVKYTTATAEKDSSYIPVADESGVTCGTRCDQTTTICKSSGATLVKDFYAKQKTGTILKACVDSIVTGVKASEEDIKESITCDTSCGQTKYCASSPLDTVKSYLAKQRANFASCEATANGSFSVAFGPIDPKPAGDYCADGNARLTTVPDQIIEHAKMVSEEENGVVKDLKTFIKGRFKDIYGSSNPLITSFVMKQGDKLEGRQSVGANYIQLSADMGGKSESVLSPSYSGALKELSSQLEKRINRTVQFVQMAQGQNILRVWVNGRELQKMEWSSIGKTLSIADSVPLQKRDIVSIDFK